MSLLQSVAPEMCFTRVGTDVTHKDLTSLERHVRDKHTKTYYEHL
jgi:hypothetical protein